MKSQFILAAFKHPRLVSDFLNLQKGPLMTFLQPYTPQCPYFVLGTTYKHTKPCMEAAFCLQNM